MSTSEEILIVGAAPLSDGFDIAPFAERASFIIAVDGGGTHLARSGVTPHLALGDFDSLPPSLLECYRKQSVSLKSFPPAKDKTDLELAVEEALARGPSRVTFCAVTGGDPDHNLANIHLLATAAHCFTHVRCIDEQCQGIFLAGPASFSDSFQPGTRVSLVPLTPTVEEVTLTGTEWPLHSATLFYGSTHTLRNVVREKLLTVSLSRGTMVVWIFGGVDIYRVRTVQSLTYSDS